MADESWISTPTPFLRKVLAKPVAQFPEPKEVGPREWGKEILLCLSPGNYSMKRIEMRKGSEGGLQKHHLKDEAGVVLYGSADVIYADSDDNLVQRTVDFGDCFHFPAGSVHKIVALTDFCYIECSTPHFNDRIKLDDKGGLESTKLEDVVTT